MRIKVWDAGGRREKRFVPHGKGRALADHPRRGRLPVAPNHFFCSSCDAIPAPIKLVNENKMREK